MNDDEKDLIRQAQTGDQRAFEKLVRKYDKKVLALAFQFVENVEDAKDIYQEAFMRAYHKIHRFRFESQFYTWLYRIVVNCAISYRKKGARQRHQSIEETMHNEDGWHLLPPNEEPKPDALAIREELREQIQSNLETLSLMQRTVFVLRFYEDFKIKDIAEIIGRTEGTVKNYLFRSVQKMKKRLSPYIKS